MLENEKQYFLACYLNNLYGSYVSVQTFLIFLNGEKATKRKQSNSQEHLKINHLKIFQKEE